MGVQFARGSNTFLRTTNSFQKPRAVPFTIGLWFKCPTSAVNEAMWGVSNNDGITYYTLDKSATDVLRTETNAGVVNSFTLFQVDIWTHVIVRKAATAIERSTMLTMNGRFEALNSTSSFTPSFTTLAVGALDGVVNAPSNATIAEFWWAESDVFQNRTGANLTYNEHAAIAFNGPWIFPSLAKSIRVYHSFRRGYRAFGYEDLTWNKFPTPPWAVSGTLPLVAPHPPGLKYPYRNDLTVPGRQYFDVAVAGTTTQQIYGLPAMGAGR